MTPFNRNERLSVVARLAKAHVAVSGGQTMLGRTALMKMMYFLQEEKGVPLGYDFRLFSYGPFDSEVLSDLATATTLDIVQESTVFFNRGYGYQISTTPQSDDLARQLESSRAQEAALVDLVVKELGRFSAADLELRSTVHFVKREFEQTDDAPDRSKLVDRVKVIKPHFTSEVIGRCVDELTRPLSPVSSKVRCQIA